MGKVYALIEGYWDLWDYPTSKSLSARLLLLKLLVFAITYQSLLLWGPYETCVRVYK